MDLNVEENRLKTFNNWNIPFVNKHQLALLGFYYYDLDDIVKCYFCSVEIGKWERGDDVLASHIKWSPSCNFIRGRITNNIPINNPNAESHDFNPDFAVEAKRLESYGSEWPNIKQRPQELSNAGFFYTGKGDRVCCFKCGGGLKDWEENDDPWEQHAIWYGKCEYLKLMKGDTFIINAQKKKYAFGVLRTVLEDEIEKKICKICYLNDYDTVFLPCGHIIACAKCASNVDKCPMCRQPFKNITRVYFS
jgi:hypothetical protein